MNTGKKIELLITSDLNFCKSGSTCNRETRVTVLPTVDIQLQRSEGGPTFHSPLESNSDRFGMMRSELEPERQQAFLSL